MGKIAVLTAILGGFDTPVDPVSQDIKHSFHRFTDKNFPPITGLTPRLQYRIPKTHGWQMFPGYDVYVWLDGSMTFTRPDSLKWLLEQLGEADVAFFRHPWRKTVAEEVEHIEEHLKKEKPYITSRYKNGLHREFLTRIQNEDYSDQTLYASTAFIYLNTPEVQEALKDWWYEGSRYFTCDQVNLPFVLKYSGLKVSTIDEDIFNNPYLKIVSPHK